AGTAFSLPFVRGAHVTFARTVFAPEQGRALGDALDTGMRLFLAAAGIVLIARGSAVPSLFAGLFLCGISIYEGFTNVYAGPPALAISASIVAQAFGGFWSYLGRFLFAFLLLPRHVPRWLRVTLIGGFALISIPFYASLFARTITLPLFGTEPLGLYTMPYFSVQFALGLYLLGVFALAAFYARGQNAGAVRLIFAALVVSYVGPAANFIAAINGLPYPLHGNLNLTYLALALALPYAVLSKRLVAVDFVVSKALIYSIVLSVIVGVFVLAERVIEQAALGRIQSYALELLVPLVLGLSIRRIERWTEGVVERVLYREKMLAERELEALAEDFPHARDVGALAKRVAADIHRYMHSPSVCVYRESERIYVPIASAGQSETFPVNADDPVFMRIRAKRMPVQTEDFNSALPAQGTVFPLVVFGTVTGAIYCHFRESGERFDPDEMETLRKLAHELAIALLWVERQTLVTPSTLLQPY
ncbi:MAG: GAF domain-containing protein, partial [Candidatus Eremiobacteraeota bacterium]|nr:GAF domain-containing protein [Candidatus Eremiobacteraeota bacterium]